MPASDLLQYYSMCKNKHKEAVKKDFLTKNNPFTQEASAATAQNYFEVHNYK